MKSSTMKVIGQHSLLSADRQATKIDYRAEAQRTKRKREIHPSHARTRGDLLPLCGTSGASRGGVFADKVDLQIKHL